jgi:hypothetical protein
MSQEKEDLRALLEVLHDGRKLKEWLSWPIHKDWLYRAIRDRIAIIEGGTDPLKLHRRLQVLERRAEHEDTNKRKARATLAAFREARDEATDEANKNKANDTY